MTDLLTLWPLLLLIGVCAVVALWKVIAGILEARDRAASWNTRRTK